MRLHGIELNQGAVIRNANIQRGSILPDSDTTAGQLFFNTEEDTLYVRDATNIQWNSIGSYTLSDLTDVEVGGAEHGQALIYDEVSEKWNPGAGGGGEGATFLNELADVDTSETTLDGNVLGYDETTGNWIGVPNDGAVSVVTNNVSTDGTFSHDDGNGTIVTISLNSEDLPFNDESIDDPVLASDNVRDAINEVKDLVISKQAISTMVDNMATSGTIAHNDGQGTGIVIDLNSDSIPFESGYSPSEIEADNVRDAIDQVHDLASSLVIDMDTTYYISPTGDDDSGDGTEDNPWYSPHKVFEYLNGRNFLENIKITIDADEGDYTFTEPLILSHLQGSQIEMIGAALLGNKPKKFKLPDFTDPLNPTQDPRDVDDIYSSQAALSVEATIEERVAAAEIDRDNNNILVQERFATRFIFSGGGPNARTSAIKFSERCGINLIDNILFDGTGRGYNLEATWDDYFNDGALDMPSGSFAHFGENSAIVNFQSSFASLEGATLIIDEPLILNCYGIYARSGSNVKINGISEAYFTDSSDVPSGTFHFGANRPGVNSSRNSLIEMRSCSFICGAYGLAPYSSEISSSILASNWCVVGTHVNWYSLFWGGQNSLFDFSPYKTMITGIGGASENQYLFQLSHGGCVNTVDSGSPTIYIKGNKFRFAHLTSQSRMRLRYPTFTSNPNLHMYCYHNSLIENSGYWSIDDSNSNISINVSHGGRITIEEPGSTYITENAVLNTAYGKLTKDGSYIGLSNIKSLHKKWEIAELDMTVVEGDRMLVNADSADVTITLPSSPKDSDEVIFRMIRNNNGANAFLIDPGAETINDVAGVSNVGDVLHRDLTLVYHTYGWWATGGNVDGGTY